MSVRVILDNCTDVYFPGQTIAGKIECNFNEETQLRSLRVKFRGRGKTDWHETESYGSGNNRSTRRVRYCAEENYFYAEYNLVQGGEDFKLPAGQHTYPFSYILPPQLPSAFEGVYGSVRYYVEATVDRPWKFDYEDRVCLNLVSPLDLNYLPYVREPVNISVDKTMCSCWCTTSGGALTFTMSLPAAGFVSGQEMNITWHVQNMTNVNVESVKFKISEMIEYISHFPSTRHTYEFRTVADCREEGIGAHGEKSWTTTFVLPIGHFENLNPCGIINVSYTLEAEVVVPYPHTNLDTAVPITMGSIPLSGIGTSVPGGLPLPSAVPSLLPAAPASYAYPPVGVAPYPPSGSTPYLPPFGDTKQPPPVRVLNGYGEKNPSAPPGDSMGAPYPPGAPSLGLPLYDDSQNFKEKNEKSG